MGCGEGHGHGQAAGVTRVKVIHKATISAMAIWVVAVDDGTGGVGTVTLQGTECFQAKFWTAIQRSAKRQKETHVNQRPCDTWRRGLELH